MLQLIKNTKGFFYLTVLFTIMGAVLLLLTDKGDIEIWVNQRANPVFNYFFFFITYLGDGLLIVFIIVLLLLWKLYYGIAAGITFAVSSLITQSMKRLMFYDFPRPSKFFDTSINLKFVDGLELHSWYSFPSGHSSGAFTIFLLLSFFIKNQAAQIAFFFLALLAAFSRVYLLQHFFLDIYAGSLLGVIITYVTYFIIDEKTKLPANTKLNKSLLRVF